MVMIGCRKYMKIPLRVVASALTGYVFLTQYLLRFGVKNNILILL